MASCSHFVVPDPSPTTHQPSGHRFPQRAFGKKNRAGDNGTAGTAMAILVFEGEKWRCLDSNLTCVVTLRGRIKEAARSLRKQDPALPENRDLNRCEVCFKQV